MNQTLMASPSTVKTALSGASLTAPCCSEGSPPKTDRVYPLAQRLFKALFWLLSPKTSKPYQPRLTKML